MTREKSLFFHRSALTSDAILHGTAKPPSLNVRAMPVYFRLPERYWAALRPVPSTGSRLRSKTECSLSGGKSSSPEHPKRSGYKMNPVVSHVRDWFTSRFPYYPLKHLLLDEEIPGGASFAYTLGAGILSVLSLQIVSGIIQLFS